MDGQLRSHYLGVFDVDPLGPAGHEDSHIEDAEFSRYPFYLKISQGTGGFCLYALQPNPQRHEKRCTSDAQLEFLENK